MVKIYNISDNFPMEHLAIHNPVVKNGAYFMKMSYNDAPVYFQAPKCCVKTGFVKSGGKRMFCDFVFSNEDDQFLAWLESLEEMAKSVLFQNRDKWFETPLDEHDIENSIISPFKSYRSGKFYIIRANVETNLGKCNLKIYDENENEADPETIADGTKCLVIFEFRGIRCSSKSFQFDIDLKQMLLVQPESLFERCVFKRDRTSVAEDPNKSAITSNTMAKEPPAPVFNPQSQVQTKELPIEKEKPQTKEELQTKQDSQTKEEPEIKRAPQTIEEIHLEEMPAIAPTSTDEIHEIEIDLDEMGEPLHLRPRNDVYYKLYKEAREKAKEAKMIALSHYLEAKRIKTTYLLGGDLSESDGEEDEIYKVSP